MEKDNFQLMEVGNKYQDFVMEKLYKMGLPLLMYSSLEFQRSHGENMAGIEIKLDRKYKRYDSHYIEISERTNAKQNFRDSGIFRNDNSWLFLIGDYEEANIFSIRQLRSFYNKNNKSVVCTKTSKGFILSRNEIEKLKLRTIKFEEVNKDNGRR